MLSFILILLSYHISLKTAMILLSHVTMKLTHRNILLIVILSIAFILRFWQYDQRYGIGYDGSRDAFVAFESARQIQLPLTGSFSSIGPITFGPWYYYYITFASMVIPSIWAPWMAIGLASILMVLVMYKIGCVLLNPSFGLLLAFISAISPAQVSASTPLQQHALIGLLSSLVIYLFLKVMTDDKNGKTPVIWGFLTGIAINTHFQATGLLTLPVILFLFSKKKKFIITYILGLFISMIPILTFELNNHWFNTRNILDYIFIGQYRIWTSNRWLTFLGKFWPEFWSYVTGLPIVISSSVMFASVLLLTAKFFKKKIPLSWVLISICFVIQLVLLRYYRGEKYFGYLQFFHPFTFIYTGYFLYSLCRKTRKSILIAGVLALYLFFVLPNSVQNLKADEFNLETKQRLNFLTTKYPHSKFSTFECKKTSDTNRIQGLLLLLYMNKFNDEKGEKIAIHNPFCLYGKNEIMNYGLVNISNMSKESLDTSGLVQMTPEGISDGTARWWFKKQP